MTVTLSSTQSCAARRAARREAPPKKQLSRWRRASQWIEDSLFVDRSCVLMARALMVATALSALSLYLFEAKNNDTVLRDRPSRLARAHGSATAFLRLSHPAASGAETKADAAALDSDFSLEQAALTWSHRKGMDEESSTPGVMRFGSVKVQQSIVARVVRAAEKTDMDPALLMAIADKESNFSVSAHAKTSSASGLFQFIDKTWLQALKKYGERHGHGDAARAIAAIDDDELSVSPERRTKILNLRNDPYLSAALAAEVLKQESAEIGEKIGRALTAGEIYLVHFLGPEDATRMIKAHEDAPNASAAALFPKPARANRPIFYEGGGRGRTVGEVHEAFEAMMGKRTTRYGDVAAKLPVGVNAYAE